MNANILKKNDNLDGIEELIPKEFDNLDWIKELRLDEREEIQEFIKKRIDLAIDTMGFTKTGMCKTDAVFCSALSKYMGYNNWGLSSASIKNYLNGKFGNDIQQFIDFVYGVTYFFHLRHVKDIFLPNEREFVRKIKEAYLSLDNEKKKSSIKEENIPSLIISYSSIVNFILKQSSLFQYFLAGFFITFIFCFIGNVVGCYFSGTLSGKDPNRIYFIQDNLTLVNYMLVCPMSIGLNIILMIIYKRLCDINVNTAKAYNGENSSVILTNSMWGFSILAISYILTRNYVSEILNPQTHLKIYWYIGHVSEFGDRKLGFIGIYYVILNFIFIFFMLNPLAIFIRLLLLSVNFIKSFKKISPDNIILTNVEEKIFYIIYGYILLEFLTIIYMINGLTWKLANPNKSINFTVMITILTVIGLLVVPLIRYAKYPKLNSLKKVGIKIEYDMSPSISKEFVYYLFPVIIGCFIGIFWFI